MKNNRHNLLKCILVLLVARLPFTYHLTFLSRYCLFRQPSGGKWDNRPLCHSLFRSVVVGGLESAKTGVFARSPLQLVDSRHSLTNIHPSASFIVFFCHATVVSLYVFLGG